MLGQGRDCSSMALNVQLHVAPRKSETNTISAIFTAITLGITIGTLTILDPPV
jgi:hypothetical protein